MDASPAKRSVGLLGGGLAAILAVLGHGADDCARAGARVGSAGADDIARPALVEAAALSDDAARPGLSSLGDDAAGVGMRSRTNGISLSAASEEGAWSRELVDEVAANALGETVQYAADFGLSDDTDAVYDDPISARPERLALSSLAALDAHLAKSDPGGLLVLTAHEIDGPTLSLEGGASAEVRTILGHCLVAQRRCVVVACRTGSGPECSTKAAELAKAASAVAAGSSGRDVLVRLVELRDGRALGDVILYRATLDESVPVAIGSWYAPRS